MKKSGFVVCHMYRKRYFPGKKYGFQYFIRQASSRIPRQTTVLRNKWWVARTTC
ncbi:hypothetical protein SAMN05216359_101415 [Roseateles sp. YR242]|nr:hypothetical protein SAMN05216359_101415 [Roseateles sp. YR242]